MINPKQLLCDHWGVIISASDASTISRDIAYLTLKSQQYIDDMAKKTLPFMYQKSIDGINEALKECWHIYNQKDTVPPLVRLSALRLVKDCNEATPVNRRVTTQTMTPKC